MPPRLHMRLTGELTDYSVEGASSQSMATWLHENTHFLQTIFSGYGQASWDRHRQMTSFLVYEWNTTLSEAGSRKRRLPLAHAAKQSPMHLAHALVADRTGQDWINIGRARFYLSNPGITLKDLGIRLLAKPWAANPAVTLGETEVFIQGKDIVEGHAQFVEATFAERELKLPREEVWNRETLPQQYWRALDWFVEQCGTGRYDAFPAICDLALQTSEEPLIATTEDEWRASHPAWRFVKLTECLREKPGIPLEDTRLWVNEYIHMANVLLGSCGFKPVESILEERLTALASKEHLLKLEELMRRAIEFRVARPWCLANPALDPAFLGEILTIFPAPLVEIKGQFASFAPTENIAQNRECVMELQFQALAAQVFGDFSRAAVREKAIECAFSKFDVPQGCEFQRTHGCTGRYRLEDGPPHPVERSPEGLLSGCSFEMLLNASGTSSIDIDIDHEARLPTDDELHVLEKNLAQR